MSAELDCIHYIVMGVGINTGQREFPEELREKATSLPPGVRPAGEPMPAGGGSPGGV